MLAEVRRNFHLRKQAFTIVLLTCQNRYGVGTEYPVILAAATRRKGYENLLIEVRCTELQNMGLYLAELCHCIDCRKWLRDTRFSSYFKSYEKI